MELSSTASSIHSWSHSVSMSHLVLLYLLVLSPIGWWECSFSCSVALVQAGPWQVGFPHVCWWFRCCPSWGLVEAPIFTPASAQVTFLQKACLAGMPSAVYFSDQCCHQWFVTILESVQRDGWPMFHDAEQDPESHGGYSRAVMSLVQQGLARSFPFFHWF